MDQRKRKKVFTDKKWLLYKNKNVDSKTQPKHAPTIHPVLHGLKMVGCSLPREHLIGPWIRTIAAGNVNVRFLRHPFRRASRRRKQSLCERGRFGQWGLFNVLYDGIGALVKDQYDQRHQNHDRDQDDGESLGCSSVSRRNMCLFWLSRQGRVYRRICSSIFNVGKFTERWGFHYGDAVVLRSLL